MYFKFFLKIIMKFQFLTILICFSFIIGCNNSSKKETVTISNNQKKSNIPKPIIKNISKKKLKEFNLVDIQEINKSIKVELKYATTDNFMKIKLTAIFLTIFNTFFNIFLKSIKFMEGLYQLYIGYSKVIAIMEGLYQL